MVYYTIYTVISLQCAAQTAFGLRGIIIYNRSRGNIAGAGYPDVVLQYYIAAAAGMTIVPNAPEVIIIYVHYDDNYCRPSDYRYLT